MSDPASPSRRIDPEVLASIQELQQPGETDLLPRLVGLFLENAKTQLGSIRRGVPKGDREEVSRAAHALKSSSGTIGARTLRALCARLEREAKTLGDPEILDMIQRIEEEVQAAWTELQAHVQATASRESK